MHGADRENPGLVSVDSDLKLNTPEFRIEIDSPKSPTSAST